MEKLNLFLHIGSSKTGTTYIQNFLDVNRSFLYSNYEILYPNFAENDLRLGSCRNHSKWYQSIRNDESRFLHEIERLINFTHSHSINSVILSNEGWLFDPTFIPLFSKLSTSTKQVNITTICYLRRIDNWAESTWKQFGLKTYETIEEYFNQPELQNKYQLIYNRLDKWANYVGAENIIIRPYEKQQLPNGILQDFFTQVGIDKSPIEWNNSSDLDKNLNSGFNRDVLELLHYCRDLYKDVHDNRLFGLFTDLLGEDFQKKPFEEYSLISPEQRLSIIESNLPFEKLIAKKFMGKENGKIFLDPLPNLDDPWQQYQGLTLEKAIPIIIKLIDENNQIIKKQKKSNIKFPNNLKTFENGRLLTASNVWKKIKQIILRIKNRF